MNKNKQPLGVRLNNPCNIRYNRHNNWLGQFGSVNGFCKFILPYYGIRAFALLYHTYLRNARDTITRFISCYAPSAENNTRAYINFVCNYMGCGPHYKLSLKDFPKFAKAVCTVEVGDYSKQYFGLIDNYKF